MHPAELRSLAELVSRAEGFLVVDLEATCADGRQVPDAEREIIEIGAVLLDASLETVAEFQTFVRPVRHPTLTPFCIQLTSIRQEDADAAPPFPEALAALAEWSARSSPSPPLFASWGRYDRNQFLHDCEFHKIEFPLGEEHLNLKAAFSLLRNTKRKYGVSSALRELGLDFEGTPHRGIDDARNIARIARGIVESLRGRTDPR